ncbi:MAG: hypothetical protein AB7O65_11820 [Candidatus Korobacteraceae bacterium]
MILLLTSSEQAPSIVGAIQSSGGEKVEIAADIRTALKLLDKHDFNAVVFDNSLDDRTGGEVELLLDRIGMAMPVFTNLGLNHANRVVRQTLLALQRGQQERAAALALAQSELGSQISSDLTAILLTTEQLVTAELPTPVNYGLKRIFVMADRIRARVSVTRSASWRQTMHQRTDAEHPPNRR